ncbi:DsbA family protein [Pseudomonas fluorescens]|jgi:protein-disulfide isomerase|uniref:Thioredoxin domain-containing protein n=1 Tax=Pseudomonas lurida TaxID=244566 RepID=A0ABY9G2V2_9PSED|nr:MULTISPECIES: thioredoxin domain-containing protein [Pseudomonas]MBD8739036.1 DsbA family protein [Pseudomonas fluorescens]MBC3248219.1 DsbA family protein [Pseudomonas lurida]NWB73208.1 DsbA family protein [Pseudomonas sp. G5001]TKK05198.1 disulfide bond formation protein DsbA [Pseudomonas fluorescens]WLH09919.1 thioredoxin domain-containing protein [Pseudomonas lurida]
MRLGRRWAIPSNLLLASVALACLITLSALLINAFIKREAQIPRHTGPWLLGPADARWTVTEFADLECPYCKIYTPALKAWVQQQKSVNLQWQHLPLDFHGSAAITEAKIVECAGELSGAPAFWQAVDQVFERTRSNGLGFNGQLDINDVSHQALMACAANNRQIALRISRQAEEAMRSGVTATPTVLIRDNKTGRSLKLEGPADDVMLLSAIDLLIEKGN